MELTRITIYRRILFTCFWIWAVFGFVQDEILPFLVNLQSIVFVTLDIILLIMGLITARKTIDIVMGLSFIALTAISTIFVNNLTLANYLNGFREFLPFVFMVPLLRFFLDNERYRDVFIRRFDKHLLIFLIIQVPCMVYQFLKYGANELRIEVTNLPASEWITYYAAFELVSLLNDTSKTLTEISELMNFSNISSVFTPSRKHIGAKIP